MFERLLLLSMMLTAVGCATVTTGSRETIHVDSKPSGATATMTCENGFRAVETTPVSISVARDAGECKVRVAKDGFEEAVVTVTQAVNPAYFLNLWTAAVPVLFKQGNLREGIGLWEHAALSLPRRHAVTPSVVLLRDNGTFE